MSDYIIKNSSGQLQLIKDSELDTTFSIGLIGDNYVNFGHTMAQNFLHMLENFASDTPPQLNQYINYDSVTKITYPAPTMVVGQLWYDTENGILKVYNTNEEWLAITSVIARVTEDILPDEANDVSIGSYDSEWDYIYARHIVANTSGDELAISGPPSALHVNGDFVIRSTSNDNNFTGRILPYTDGAGQSKAQIGALDAIFDKTFTKELYFDENGVGLTLSQDDIDGTFSLIPASISGADEALSIGSQTKSMDAVNTRITYTDALSSLSGRGGNASAQHFLSLESDILPSNSSIFIGNSLNRINSVFGDTVNVNTIASTPGGDGLLKVTVNSNVNLPLDNANITLNSKTSSIGMDYRQTAGPNGAYLKQIAASTNSGAGIGISNGLYMDDAGAVRVLETGGAGCTVSLHADADVYAGNPHLLLGVTKASMAKNEVVAAPASSVGLYSNSVTLISRDFATPTANINDITITPTRTDFNKDVHIAGDLYVDAILSDNLTLNAGNISYADTDLTLDYGRGVLIKDGAGEARNAVKLEDNLGLKVGDPTLPLLLQTLDNLPINIGVNVGAATPKPLLWVMLESVYPVGSIYENAMVDSDPKGIMGWNDPAVVWVRYATGRVTIGADYVNSFPTDIVTETPIENFGLADPHVTLTMPVGYAEILTLGEIGGDMTHALTLEEIPSHAHTMMFESRSSGEGAGKFAWQPEAEAGHPERLEVTDAAGGLGGVTQAHNNMQPWVGIARWVRIS